ncbi:HAM1 domain-containing protein [Ordospora colligata]|uniref:HAM1 domain-containing protein n=1 Tax=Ordospora colligata OC4 TaxID=1354746 RepID=A0A0B2UHF6_9MICR|nr:HAM1 domain-containing protein [Ordospora colligata OC4]KHN70511.1 HAM1 domain-containing protein [Ordospora colligata OC4]TBU17261.1 HAM1 domain-containing protein [Ordospora colligata]TBU17511.1 HAM1 domain-containing protein [Ordospora colligata]TBU19691.1 HAM1 domain-containing protein [Ordospora colligata]
MADNELKRCMKEPGYTENDLINICVFDRNQSRKCVVDLGNKCKDIDFGDISESIRKLQFITSNSYKHAILQELLGIPVMQVKLDIEEIQGSKEAIVADKLRKVCHLVNECNIVIIDDTSIHIDGLYGFPGQYAKDFLSIGMKKVIDVAKKVGDLCRYSTIIGLAYAHEGDIVMKTFDGEVTGRIVLKEAVEPKLFRDVFVARDEEYFDVPDGLAGIKIGRYRAVQKMQQYLMEMNICIREEQMQFENKPLSEQGRDD